MKLTAISDTHGLHRDLALGSGDVLIHAGDCTRSGKDSEAKDFMLWLSEQDYKHKVFIAGNHDWWFERATTQEVQKSIPKGVTYLNDSGISIDGIKFWGSPVQPWFLDWAFNRQRGSDIQKHWDLIPSDTDVMISHGPAYGILDRVVGGEQVGCKGLLKTLEAIKPQHFVFGHIHEAYGNEQRDGINYINASVLNERYQLVNAPIHFEI